MRGWGQVPGFVAFGLVLAAACGGRTNALEGDYGYGADGSGAEAGSGGASAGRGGSSAGRGGSSAGRGGSRPVGGGGFGGVGGAYYPGGDAGYYPGGYGGFGGAYYPGGYAGIGGYFPGGYAGVPFGGYAGVPIGGFGGGAQGCQDCLRNACTGQLVQCLSDFGCISIFTCMQQTGCNGFECYSPDSCQKVIDQYGGPNGNSMNELLQVVVCGFQAGCQCN